jgi:hypothetical protein
LGRTATVTLDDKEYTLHALNLGELQDVGSILKDGGEKEAVLVRILAIALKRAEPKVEDVNLIEPRIKELQKAVNTVLELSGFETQDPQTAAPAEGS